ncbi:Rab2/RabB-family small GTPase [Reticulomyxa filosa]|uniref:Rab2/RabB-family small GTPase n=1 Tax=Reticulomyxa filosa TaxID=46433 RepID=X6NXG6_RETFI|nr:Rab2/RabB-family small GTPase [Reticulomyxa filosa]|eukprot:ETO29957.1 Rab2/RabB-family small GTPase [Reticulomyxa filosa]
MLVYSFATEGKQIIATTVIVFPTEKAIMKYTPNFFMPFKNRKKSLVMCGKKQHLNVLRGILKTWKKKTAKHNPIKIFTKITWPMNICMQYRNNSTAKKKNTQAYPTRCHNTTNTNNTTCRFKFIAIGDTGVGKSCLLLQFTDHRFNPDHELTIGVEFGTSTIQIQDHAIKLQIWDTAVFYRRKLFFGSAGFFFGQETFRSITRSYYRNTAGCLLVYDITRRETFAHVSQWLEDARSYGSSTMTVVLVGNKCDLDHLRQVTTQEGESYAKDKGLLFIETSAKASIHVNDVFLLPSTRIYEKVQKGELDPSDQSSGVQLGVATKKLVAGNAKPQGTKKADGDSCCTLL